MWIVNNNKERMKSYLCSDIESNITNITDSSNRMSKIVMELDSTISGAASGIDAKMIGECRRSIEKLSVTLQYLHYCRSLVGQLNTKEWVDDG